VWRNNIGFSMLRVPRVPRTSGFSRTFQAPVNKFG
jgi:hypothetical protein